MWHIREFLVGMAVIAMLGVGWVILELYRGPAHLRESWQISAEAAPVRKQKKGLNGLPRINWGPEEGWLGKE